MFINAAILSFITYANFPHSNLIFSNYGSAIMSFISYTKEKCSTNYYKQEFRKLLK